MLPVDRPPNLDAFGVTADDLLGRGGEAHVYALDAERVLRIYKGDNLDYLDERRAFYAGLRGHGLPFATPDILEIGSREGALYTVERRIHGRDFAQALPTLTGAARATALSSYLEVAGQIGTVRLPQHPFGELVTPDTPIRRETWGDYLRARMAAMLAGGRADLEQDVPNFTAVLGQIEDRFSLVADWPEKRLVHGDYFPGNVFIDAEHRICAVGDFGYSTVAGDPRMDLVGAVIFLEVVEGYRPADSQFLLRQLADRLGDGWEAVVEFYRLYYSIYFSGCKADDPNTYWWCVGNLRAV